MMPFQVQLIDGVWNVIVNDKNIECSSKTDAEVLAQIPVQFELMRVNAQHHPPDRKVVESIINLGDAYPRIRSIREFQHMKAWLAKELT